MGLDLSASDGAQVFTRHGNRSTNNAPGTRTGPKDGSWATVSASAQQIANRVMRLVGHSELIDEPWFGTGYGRVEHVELIDRYVGEWIGARNRDEVLQAFVEADAAAAPIHDARDIVEDVHIRETQMITEVDDEDVGPMLMLNVMWRMSESPGLIRFTGRPLGADTDSVLIDDLGLPASEVERLREAGGVA